MEHLFITGATGFIGARLLAGWLERTSARVTVFARPHGAASSESRLRRLVSGMTQKNSKPGVWNRITVADGDLTHPQIGLTKTEYQYLTDSVTHIIHCAAAVHFGMDIEQASQINLRGTEEVLSLAKQCGKLQRFDYLSTAYVAGKRTGLIKEDELDRGQEHHNSYEKSKFEAEKVVAAALADYRVQRIVRDWDRKEPGSKKELPSLCHVVSTGFCLLQYGRNLLIELDQHAILFTNGDYDTFPLWALQGALGWRTDVSVVNLSLLNAPWYVKHIKNRDPSVPIGWSDAEIERLRPNVSKNELIPVSNIVVRNILEQNRWRQPLYFAVTIEPEKFSAYREYLQGEGLCYKMVPKKVQDTINTTKLEDNLYKKFSYDGVLTSDWRREHMYLSKEARRITQNYAAAFVQLAIHKRANEMYDKALRSMEIAAEISPNLKPVVLQLGVIYQENGEAEKAVTYLKVSESMSQKWDCITLHGMMAEVG